MKAMVAKSMFAAHQPTLPLGLIPLCRQSSLNQLCTLPYVLCSYSSSPSILKREL